jgi:hypothetical protein
MSTIPTVHDVRMFISGTASLVIHPNYTEYFADDRREVVAYGRRRPN